MGKDEKLAKKRIVLDELNQDRSIDQEEYRARIKEYQLRLLMLQRIGFPASEPAKLFVLRNMKIKLYD